MKPSSRLLAGVAVLALLVLSPTVALAQDPAPPAPAPPEVCAAVTVEGADLIRSETQAGAILVAAGIEARGGPGDVAKARTELGCGEAPTGRTPEQVRADVCAALDVKVLSGVIQARTGAGGAQAQAQGDLAVAALPPVVAGARAQLSCTAGDPAGPTPSTDPAAVAPEPSDGAAPAGDDCTTDTGAAGLPVDGTCIPRVGGPTGGDTGFGQVGAGDVPKGGVDTGGRPDRAATSATTVPVPGLNRGESARFHIVDTGRSYLIVGRAQGMDRAGDYVSLVYPDGKCSKPAGDGGGLTLGGSWQAHGDRDQMLYERYEGAAYRAVKAGGGIGSVSIRAITKAENTGSGNFTLTAEARACATVGR